MSADQIIEAESADDSGVSDFESVYSAEIGSITDTLPSLATRWKNLHGRQFGGIGEYIIPIDDKQQESMDMFHDIYFRALGDKLYRVPIDEKSATRAVDLATGNGTWALDFADGHPTIQVTGTDLAPIQPVWVPPNLTFEIDDMNGDWAFKKESIDFVHVRASHGAVADWSKLMANAFRALKPGGWVEVVGEDVKLYCDDGTLPENTPIAQWMQDSIDAMKKLNLDLEPYGKLKDQMSTAGFDIGTYKHEIFPVPIGTWPKKKEEKALGAMMLVNLLHGIEGWAIGIYTQLIGKSEDEVRNVLLPEWYKDLRQKKHHKYMKINVVYVQKPASASSEGK